MFRILAVNVRSCLVPLAKPLSPRSFTTYRSVDWLRSKNVKSNLLWSSPVMNVQNILFKRNMSLKAVPKLSATQRKDGVPSKYEMIYRSDLITYFRFAQYMLVIVVGGIVARLGFEYVNWLRSNAPDGDKSLGEAVAIHEEDLGTISKMLAEMKTPVGNNEEGKIEIKPTLDDLTDGDSVALLVFVALTVSLYACVSKLLARIPVRMYASPSGNIISVHMSSVVPGKKNLREFQAGTLRRVPSKVEYFKDIHFQDPNGKYYFLLDGYFKTPSDLDNLIEK